MTIVRYALSDEAWRGYDSFLNDLLSRWSIKSVCEVGGGANPSLKMELIKGMGLEYTILDIAEDELAKASEGYLKIQADICAAEFLHEDCYDLVISKMLAEHVKDGRIFHKNIQMLLKPGGRAFHFFPTLYAPPFVLNHMLPERLSEALLSLVQSGRGNTGRRGKFTAYYKWCRGPTRAQIQRFEDLGYIVDEYIGFYGHPGYYEKVQVVKRLHEKISGLLLQYPNPILTSFAYVLLRKAQSKSASK